MTGLVLGVLYLGGNLMSRGELGAGELMAFLMATQSLHRSLAQISLLFGHVIRGASAAAHISEVGIIFFKFGFIKKKLKHEVTTRITSKT